MQKKNLIYIIGGAAVVGYFIYMKRKKSAEIPSASVPVTPDQELAPAFVNQTSEAIKQVAKKIRSRKSSLKSAAPIDEETGMLAPSSPLSEVMQDMGIKKPTILSAKAARQSARSTKQEVRASGGSAKQARQAARSVRKEARQARKLGDLPVTF